MLHSMVFLGDHDKQASFSSTELRVMKTDKWRNKVENHLSKVPHKFKLAIVNRVPKTAFLDVHTSVLNEIFDHPERKMYTEETRDIVDNHKIDDGFLAILGGNHDVGASSINEINSHPFTPWIVVHRMVHTIWYSLGLNHDDIRAMHGTNANRLFSVLPRTYENYGFRSITANTNEAHFDLVTKYIVCGKLRRPNDDPKVLAAIDTLESSIDVLLSKTAGRYGYF